MEDKKVKKPFYKRWWFIVIVIFLGLGMIGNLTEGDTPEKKETVEKDAKGEEILEFNADMNAEIDNDKIVVTLNSNVADGGIFEITVINGDFEVVSDFVPIKDGKIIKEFDIPSDWEVGYLAGTAMFRFNLEEHLQPDSIKDIYGNNGEKMTGEQTEESTVDNKTYKTGTVKPITIAYPDEKTVKAKQDELFATAMQELIDASNGIVVSIEPYVAEEGWKITKVVVSDAWYNSQEHEKERFAEQIGETVQNIIINTGQVKEGEHISVYLYDTFDKELATPKMTGGYKIKR